MSEIDDWCHTQMLLNVLGLQQEAMGALNLDGHVISFEQISQLFVRGVQPTDQLEDLVAILDRHIEKKTTSGDGTEGTQQLEKKPEPTTMPRGLTPRLTIPAPPQVIQLDSAPESPWVNGDVPRPRAERSASVSTSILSSDHGEDRHAESREEAARRRESKREQEVLKHAHEHANAQANKSTHTHTHTRTHNHTQDTHKHAQTHTHTHTHTPAVVPVQPVARVE